MKTMHLEYMYVLYAICAERSEAKSFDITIIKTGHRAFKQKSACETMNLPANNVRALGHIPEL